MSFPDDSSILGILEWRMSFWDGFRGRLAINFLKYLGSIESNIYIQIIDHFRYTFYPKSRIQTPSTLGFPPNNSGRRIEKLQCYLQSNSNTFFQGMSTQIHLSLWCLVGRFIRFLPPSLPRKTHRGCCLQSEGCLSRVPSWYLHHSCWLTLQPWSLLPWNHGPHHQ